MEHRTDLLEILQHIDPAMLDYQDWINVGMALKAEGYDCSAWDTWSQADSHRYHPGDCARKWESFRGSSTPITGGTIVQLAKEQGWAPASGGHALDWDDEIGGDDYKIVDSSWLEGREFHEPPVWDPVRQLTEYLEVLFEASENVGYVTASWEKDGKYFPSKGSWDRTAGELIEQLNHCSGDIGAVLGDYNPQVGAWIRFNPMDGRGCKNENVTDYRYALVESDTMELEKQYAMIRELELPVACLVYSGGKSIHAIVRIEAANYDEYRKRVDYLYDVLKKNGMAVDTQNKNPSRLSRMPGVQRGENKQYIIDANIGKSGWKEWQEWIEGVNDDLPDLESLSNFWDNLPPLAPCLIEGVLRQGHKMLVAGPSKAGKSFALIELCIAIAEGKKWLQWQCTQGKVLYVNLELDRASCLHRFRDVYTVLGWQPKNISNIDIWNLRGKSVPMDKLAPKLIRRATKKNYIAIIIDPIYKVITGDENSADQMANFCNQFDKVCTDLGCAVIYCHHHSKGAQGGKKSMDRASGSGVFARDPDALLDLVELDLTEAAITQQQNKAAAESYLQWIHSDRPELLEQVSQDDMCSATALRNIIQGSIPRWLFEGVQARAEAAKEAVKAVTAWRVEGTLREFPKFPPVNLWFRYPVHLTDDSGILGDLEPDTQEPNWKRGSRKAKESAELKRRNKAEEFADAVENCNAGEPPAIKDLMEWYTNSGQNVTERTIRNWVKKFGFCLDRNSGKVVRGQSEDVEES